MDAAQFMENYGNVAFALVILFGGRYGLKFFKVFKDEAHNFLLFSTLWAILFILVQWSTGVFHVADAWKYILTYTAVTSAYDIVMRYVFDWIESKLGKQKPEGDVQGSNELGGDHPPKPPGNP